MYTVLSKVFATFEDVIKWAWNEHKITDFESPQTEEEKQVACRELENFIQELEVARNLD